MLAAAVFGCFGFTAHGYLENADADVTLQAARALYLRGDPGLSPTAPDASAAERVVAAEIDRGAYGKRGAEGRYYVWFGIGHQLLLVPCVALGAALAEWFPEPERAYEAARGPVFGELYWARFLASFLPALAAAGSVVAVIAIALALGCTRRQALLVAAVSAFCTQLWPGANETMADAPAGALLLATAALVLRYHRGHGGAATLLWAGVAGGWAVLLRYPHALPVAVLAGLAAHSAIRRGRRGDLGLLVVGALPEAVLLFGANLYRFGSWTETGYSPGADAVFFSYPPYLGVPAILLAPGKGALWFSPPLWLALAACCRRDLLRRPALLAALLVFAAPVLLSGHTPAWSAGQCWGVRYVTPGVVALVAVALALDKPWQRRPRLFAAVCFAGLLVSAGGVLAPYRGHQQLAHAAGAVLYPEAGANLEHNVTCDPRLSPVHTHWIYAALAASGRLEAGGAANTTLPLFGVSVPDAAARLTIPGEDAGFRHWWMVFGRDAFGWPLLPLALLWWAATISLGAFGARAFLRGG